jgi:molecular chaperone HscA
MGGLVERIIPRNSTLPAARAQDFTTFRDGQTALAVHVVQGERERVADCRSLARFELRGIPPMAAGAARIRVTFQVDADGLLAVGAREQISGIEASVVVKPSYGLGEEEITAMLRDSHIHAEDDARSRALQEQVVEAERLLESLEAAIAADGQEWLDAAERGTLDAAMAALRAAVAAGDAAAMRGTAEHLNQLSTPLAARRMDNAIRKAMSGRQLTEFA